MHPNDAIESATDNAPIIPLVLDIDGTLLRTDLLFETFWAALAHDFFATLRVLVTCFATPPLLKRRLRAIADPDIGLVPVRASILDLAHTAMAAGRPVHLASGADQGLVDAIARRFNLPGDHFGTTETRNLINNTKADFLTTRFGEQGYDYAGNSLDDQAAWQHARRIIAVSPPARLSAWLTNLGKPLTLLPERWTVGTLFQQLSPLQWIINVLVFLPLLVTPDLPVALPLLITFIVFSLGASALSIVGDLLVLGPDRQHAQRQHCPIAAGALPIQTAMIASGGLALTALLLAALSDPALVALILVYMVGCLAYSLWLKTRQGAIIAAAGLLLLRGLAGFVVTGGALSTGGLAVLFAGSLLLAWILRKTTLQAL